MGYAEGIQKHATSIMLVLIILILGWMMYSREGMCGGCDQQCVCCGYETFARGSNERMKPNYVLQNGQVVRNVDAKKEPMMGGGGHIATLGDSYPNNIEQMQGRPILYDDLLSKVGHGTI